MVTYPSNAPAGSLTQSQVDEAFRSGTPYNAGMSAANAPAGGIPSSSSSSPNYAGILRTDAPAPAATASATPAPAAPAAPAGAGAPAAAGALPAPSQATQDAMMAHDQSRIEQAVAESRALIASRVEPGHRPLDVTHLDPYSALRFGTLIRDAEAATGEQAKINYAYRDPATQGRIHAEAGGRYPAAPAGRSPHQLGVALDFSRQSPAVLAFARANAGRYALGTLGGSYDIPHIQSMAIGTVPGNKRTIGTEARPQQTIEPPEVLSSGKFISGGTFPKQLDWSMPPMQRGFNLGYTLPDVNLPPGPTPPEDVPGAQLEPAPAADVPDPRVNALHQPRWGAEGARRMDQYNEPGAPSGAGRTGDEQRAWAYDAAARNVPTPRPRPERPVPGPAGGVPRGTTSADTGQGASGLRGNEPIGLPEVGGPPTAPPGQPGVGERPRSADPWQEMAEAGPLGVGASRMGGAFDPTAPDESAGQPPVADIPTPRQRPDIHVVQPGDTLWEIAGGDPAAIREIAQTNGITNPSQISPGQVLVMPAPAEVNVPIPRERPDRTEGLVAGGGDDSGLIGSQGSLGQRDYARGLLDTPGIGGGGEEIPFNRPPSYADPGLATPTEVDRMRQELERMKSGRLPVPPGRNLGGQGSTYDPQRASDLGGGSGGNLVGGPLEDFLAGYEGRGRPSYRGMEDFKARATPSPRIKDERLDFENSNNWRREGPPQRLFPQRASDLAPLGNRPNYAELLRGGYA